MKKSITIYDIAKEANASSATVSRVLSNKDYPVSPELKQKIKRIAKELEYTPNMLGRQLKTNNNMTIGVIVPSISNPFYSSVVLGIEEIARKHGYSVLLCNSLRSPSIELEHLKTLFEKQVKGLIISSISGNKKLLKDLTNKGLNVVALDQSLYDLDGSQIHFDSRKGGYMATKYLIEKGHRKIAFVTAPLNRPSRKDMFRGYQDALIEYGIKPVEYWTQIATAEEEISDEIYEFNNGKVLTRKLLELPEMPTAIFACNDMTAFGVMKELTAQGIDVPRQVSVIGFDNIEFGQMVTPSLTTVQQPNYEMGRLSCTIMIDRLTGQKVDDVDIVLQPKLIERNSVAAPALQ
jgi:LacI family transcriptional regulator